MAERVEVHVEGAGLPPERPRGGFSSLLLIPGLGFIGLGIAVLVWNKLLVYMVAAAFMLIGVALLLGARGVKRAQRRFSMFEGQFPPR